MQTCQSADRSVKVLGPDGGLRRRRYSQQDATQFVERGLATVARWNRTRTTIICIQFVGSDSPSRPQRWLKTGTRYSYTEIIGNRQVWTHKPLPYSLVRRDLDEFATIEQVNERLGALFAGAVAGVAA